MSHFVANLNTFDIQSGETLLGKIFVDEAVAELHTIQDILRWTMSRFNAANVYYGHGTDNAWDEALQLVLPTLYLPLDVPDELLTSRLTQRSVIVSLNVYCVVLMSVFQWLT